MKRKGLVPLALGLVLSLFLLGTASAKLTSRSAAAGTYSGSWSGQTSQNAPVTFKVNSNDAITKATIKFHVNWKDCTGGSTVKIFGYFDDDPVPIVNEKFELTDDDGIGWEGVVLKGTFSSASKASGKFTANYVNGDCHGKTSKTWTASSGGADPPKDKPKYKGWWNGTTGQGLAFTIIVDNEDRVKWVLAQYHVEGKDQGAACNYEEAWWAKAKPPDPIENGRVKAKWNWLVVEGNFSSKSGTASGTMKVGPTDWWDCVGTVETTWTAEKGSTPEGEYEGSWSGEVSWPLGNGNVVNDPGFGFKAAWDGIKSVTFNVIIVGDDCLDQVGEVTVKLDPNQPIYEDTFEIERELSYSSGEIVDVFISGNFDSKTMASGELTTSGESPYSDCNGTATAQWEASKD